MSEAPVHRRGQVVLVAGSDPTEDMSGHRTYVRAHALAATAAGFSPQVFYVGSSRGVEHTAFGTLHRVYSPVRPPHTLVAAAHRPFLARALTKYLSATPGPHLIHSFGAWAATGAATTRALARHGVEAVPVASVYTTLDHESEAKVAGLVREHGVRKTLGYRIDDLWVRLVAAPSERRGYSASRLVLVNYDSVGDLVREACGPGLEIQRLPYAAPTAFCPPETYAGTPVPEAITRLGADAPLIVSVSRHDPRKGVDILLHALAGLAAARVPFRACLIGPGPLVSEHRGLARDLRLSDRVAIPGYVPDAFPYLRHADIFVLPSLEEGGGSVSMLEALQAGTAVIASRCDGIPEDVVDERDALLVAPGDVSALQAALARLLGDAGLRARLAAQAHQAFEERFSGAGLVAALTDTYASLGFSPSRASG